MLVRWRVLGLVLVLALGICLVPAMAVAVPPTVVSGTVTNSGTGLPVPFARVYLWNGIDFSVSVIADYRGRYTASVPAGEYDIDTHTPASDCNDLYDVTIPALPTFTLNLTVAPSTIEGQPVYRFFNMKPGTHFYSASDGEFLNVYENMAGVFKYDGIAYIVPVDAPEGFKPLYRFFNKKSGVHFYTMDEAEKARVMAMTSMYTYEGIAYNVTSDPMGIPIYRFYVPARNAHFYTADSSEIMNNTKLSNYYQFEGVAYYVGTKFPK